jgi:hypothetical protein
MTITAWVMGGLQRDHWLQHSLDIRIRIAAAPYMQGWGYSLSGPKVLYDLPDAMGADRIEWSSGGAKLTNCSTLTTSLMTSVRPDCPWTLQEYGDLQVFGDRLPDNPDAPVQAVARMGAGVAVTDPRPGAWHLVQGWRTFEPSIPKWSGHAFLVLADRVGEGLLMLEASSRRNVGPRYRRTTWAGLRGEYPAGLYLAALDGP